MSRRKVNANPTDDSSPQNSIKASPNAVQEVERLKELLEAEKEKGRIRDETISLLKDDKTYLQGQLGKKDELIHQLLSKKDDDNSRVMSGKSSVKCKHGDDRKAPLKKAKQLKSNVIDDEEEEFSSVLSDSSEDSSMDSHRVRKSKSPASSSSSRHQVKPSNTDDLIGGRRARNTRGIIARYKMAMDAFNRGGSMKAAFDCIGSDRNTVCRTAPIAKLSIAAPDIFKNVGAWNERKEKLSSFVDRCRAAMTPEVKEKITKMKEDGDLLPSATHV